MANLPPNSRHPDRREPPQSRSIPIARRNDPSLEIAAAIPDSARKRDFYLAWLSVAFWPSWGKQEVIAGVLGLLVPIVRSFVPGWESALDALAWQIPLFGLLAIFLVRLIVAPYRLFNARTRLSTESEQKLCQELDAARLLVDEERAKNQKPLIVGKIEEVIEEGARSIDTGVWSLDHYLTLRFWLRNERAATNFQSFKLYLLTSNAKQDRYEGVRWPLSGCYLERREPQKRSDNTELVAVKLSLTDFDAKTPLVQWDTREGWLRFVVQKVECANVEKAETVNLRLELVVTDGSGSEWTLTSEPPWTKPTTFLRIHDGNEFLWA